MWCMCEGALVCIKSIVRSTCTTNKQRVLLLEDAAKTWQRRGFLLRLAVAPRFPPPMFSERKKIYPLHLRGQTWSKTSSLLKLLAKDMCLQCRKSGKHQVLLLFPQLTSGFHVFPCKYFMFLKRNTARLEVFRTKSLQTSCFTSGVSTDTRFIKVIAVKHEVFRTDFRKTWCLAKCFPEDMKFSELTFVRPDVWRSSFRKTWSLAEVTFVRPHVFQK